MQFWNRLYTVSLAGTLFLMVFLDLLAISFPAAGYFGTVVWYFSYMLLMLFGVRCFMYILKHAFTHRLFTTVITSGLLLVLVFSRVTDLKNINHETTQQLGCTLNKLASSTGAGFHDTCFINYPLRQYLLPVLPTIIFGRSVEALNFGGGLYFIIGMIIFTAGIIRFLEKNPLHDHFAAIALAFIPHIYFVNYQVFGFEQSNYPFSYALMVCGIHFYFHKRRGIEFTLLSSLLLFQVVFIYPPGLALFSLIAMYMIYFMVAHRLSVYRKLLIGGVLISAVTIFFVSLTYRGDLDIISQSKSLQTGVSQVLEAIHHIVFINSSFPFMTPLLSSFFVISIAAFLSLLFGWRYAALAVWVCAAIVMSIVSKGYIEYGVDFKLHRATMIFPVFFSMVIFLGKAKLSKMYRFQNLIVFCYVIVLISGLYYQYVFLQKKDYSAPNALVMWFLGNVPKEDQLVRNTIYIEPTLENNLGSFADSMMYFLPNSHKGKLASACKESVQPFTNQYIVVTDLEQLRSRAHELSLNATYIGDFHYVVPGDVKEKNVTLYKIPSYVSCEESYL